MKLTIVSPVYGAQEILPELVSELQRVIPQITTDYEIILVEDASPDQSWEVVEQLAKDIPEVKGIQLSRNFGQHYAITAGLEQATGDWIVVMDCDLQDQPNEILKLYEKAKEGYDIVLAQRIDRKDGFFKKLFSKLFYGFLSYLTGTKMDHTIANFGLYHKKAIKGVLSMRETIRYFPTMVSWVGFKRATIPVHHAERAQGSSSYNFNKLFRLALDIILVSSDKPIRLFIKSGFFISFVSIIVAFFYLIKYLLGKTVIPGYTSLIISIWFLAGLIILILGVIGLYVGKTFENVKDRPIYLIRQIVE